MRMNRFMKHSKKIRKTFQQVIIYNEHICTCNWIFKFFLCIAYISLDCFHPPDFLVPLSISPSLSFLVSIGLKIVTGMNVWSKERVNLYCSIALRLNGQTLVVVKLYELNRLFITDIYRKSIFYHFFDDHGQ